MTQIIVGDVGATGAKFAVVTGNRGLLSIIDDSRFTLRTEDVASKGLAKSLHEFSTGANGIAIGAAGDVKNGKCVITWQSNCNVDADEISKVNGVRTEVWNDLAPVLPGADQLYTQLKAGLLEENPFFTINKPEGQPIDLDSLLEGLTWSIAPGSGTGVSLGDYYGNRINVFGTEAGHVSSPLPCSNSKIDELLHNYIRSKYKYPTVETVTRNSAVRDAFEFWGKVANKEIDLPAGYQMPDIVKEALTTQLPPWFREQLTWHIRQGDPNKFITESALKRYSQDELVRLERIPLCELVQFHVIRSLGLSIGNLNLYKPDGGVYLAGGVVSKLKPFLLDEDPGLGEFTFREGLRDRESKIFQDTVLRYRVTGINTPDVYSLGLAAAYAGKHSHIAREFGTPENRVIMR